MRLVAIYSMGAIILLGYLSFKWVYSHPSQVKIRIERTAREAGVTAIEVQGATQESLDGIRADKVSIKAGGEGLASLRGVHVGDVLVRCDSGDGDPTLAAVQAGGVRGGVPILVCEAKAEVVKSAGQWNLASALDAGRLRSAARVDPFEILVRELDLGLSLEGDWARRVRFENLELSGGRDGLRARAEISKSNGWDSGSFEIHSAGPGDWRIRGFIQNIRGGGSWRPLLPAAWGALWDRLVPEGDFTLRVERFSGGPTGGGFSGRLHSSSWSFTLPVVALAVARVNGSAGLGDGSISWGKPASLESPELVLLGQAGSLSGSLDDKGGAIQVAFSEQGIATAAAGVPQAIRDLMEALQPAGRLSGVLDIAVDSMAKDTGSWKLLFSLEELEFMEAAFIDPGKVLLQLEGKTDDASGGTATGSLEVEDMTIRGLASLAGSIGLTWGEEGLTLDANELAVRLPGTPDASPKGRLKGSLRTVSDGGGVEGDVDWTGVELLTGLLRAGEMSGQASIELGTGVVLGECRLKEIRVPAGILGDKELSYEDGVAEWSIEGDRIHLSALELSGPQGAVRVTGTIGFDSRLDLVCVRVGEKEAAALTALPIKSKPSDWIAASDGAYGASRLSGRMEAPLARPVYRDDKILLKDAPGDAESE